MKQQHLSLANFWGKVAVLTVVFSFLWNILFPHQPEIHYKADHTHDKIITAGVVDRFRHDPTLDELEVNLSIQRYIGGLLETDMHPSAMDPESCEKLYKSVCNIYSDICNKVSREGDYDPQDKLIYQLLIVYLINQIDERLTSQNSLRKTLSHIKIYRDEEERRWSAWHTHVKMNVNKIATPREFWEVLTHEFGHIVDLGVIAWTAPQKNANYTEFGTVEWSIDDPSLNFYEISWVNENVRKESASYKDFVSGYAMKGIYEEFAESKNLRFNHNALFYELAEHNDTLRKKYTYFYDLYNGKYFKTDPNSISLIENDKRPWDTTKIQ